MLNVVANHVVGDSLDPLGSIEDISSTAILLLDLEYLLVSHVLEQVFKLGSRTVLFVDGGISSLPFIENLDRRTIIHRILKLYLSM